VAIRQKEVPPYTLSPSLLKKREKPWALALAHTPEMKRRTATEHIRS